MEAEKLELSERIERRLEMIHAHTKHGKTIRSVIEEFNVSLGTYYYWYPRYVEMGIFCLFDSKRGPKTPHNKTSDNVAYKVVETADYHPELDAQEISKVLECSSEHKPSVSTVQRILRSKGQWARYGKTASSVLKDTEAKPLTDEELERVIRELYFEKLERIVKQNGKVKFEGKWYHVCKEMSGETVEMKVTLRGMEAWHNGAFVKRWKYWECVLDIAADYMLEKCLL